MPKWLLPTHLSFPRGGRVWLIPNWNNAHPDFHWTTEALRANLASEK
jgi:hypothetical protein